MDSTTQQNAALVEEASAASKSLEERAQSLVDLMSQFKTGAELQPRPLPTQTSARAANVTRLAQRRPASRTVSPAPAAAKVSGSDTSWQEF
jgi:methyl-accepting chemotaxis protein